MKDMYNLKELKWFFALDLIYILSSFSYTNIVALYMVRIVCFYFMVWILTDKAFIDNIKTLKLDELACSIVIGFGATMISLLSILILKPSLGYNVSNDIPYKFLVLLLIGPIYEELYYRGLIMTLTKKLVSPNLAVILSSLLFGLLHGDLIQKFYAFILGIFLGKIYQYTNNLVYCIITHIAVNFLGLGLLKIFPWLIIVYFISVFLSVICLIYLRNKGGDRIEK